MCSLSIIMYTVCIWLCGWYSSRSTCPTAAVYSVCGLVCLFSLSSSSSSSPSTSASSPSSNSCSMWPTNATRSDVRTASSLSRLQSSRRRRHHLTHRAFHLNQDHHRRLGLRVPDRRQLTSLSKLVTPTSRRTTRWWTSSTEQSSYHRLPACFYYSHRQASHPRHQSILASSVLDYFIASLCINMLCIRHSLAVNLPDRIIDSRSSRINFAYWFLLLA